MASTEDQPRVDGVDGADSVDCLYRLRPDEFVSARDALARRLRDEGRKDEADAVKKSRRPTVVAWAVDQLAEVAPGELDRLLADSERVREAQQKALNGDPGDLRRATESRRGTIDALANLAADRLVESGVSDTRHEQEIAATIDAASLDPDTAADLRAGRLERELERSGFAFPSDWVPPETGRDERAEREALREREAQRERVERDLRRARDRFEAAEEEVERLTRRLARAEGEQEAAAEAVREAEARLQEIEEEA